MSSATTSIAAFHQDEQGDWVAELACGHTQHVRHRPPWQNRLWVVTAAGRAAKIGVPIACPLCRMPELPANARGYRRTATFTEATVPAALLRDHQTKPGVWGRIVVEAGELAYRINEPCRTFVLTPERCGIVVPTVPHQVEPLRAVRFYVAFLRVEGS